MIKSFLVVLITLVSLNVFAQDTTSHDRILGKWQSEDNTRVLEFVKSGAEYEAIILKSDPASLEGKKQITGLKAHKNLNQYKDGTMHIHQKNRTGSCAVKLLNDTQLELEVSVGPMTKKMVFNRIDL